MEENVLAALPEEPPVEPPVFYRPAGPDTPAGSEPVCGDLRGAPKGGRIVFPLERQFFYSYDDTWGAPRTQGGHAVMVRADYPMGPVEAGDLFYYAHLERESPLRIGTRVSAGQVVGYAGDTGQGPPGTSGLFPPHLHLDRIADPIRPRRRLAVPGRPRPEPGPQHQLQRSEAGPSHPQRRRRKETVRTRPPRSP